MQNCYMCIVATSYNEKRKYLTISFEPDENPKSQLIEIY